MPTIQAPAPRRGYPGRGLVIGCLGVIVTFVALLAIVALVRPGGIGTHTITGAMTLHESGLGADGSSCTGKGGYDDIHGGTEVTVKDQTGKILATGQLGPGNVDAGTCDFTFSLRNVPDADFYQVEVSHRGEITYSKSELEANGWDVGLELGT